MASTCFSAGNNGSNSIDEEEKQDDWFCVFADTNMGTHIAISISPLSTAAHFARELEIEHLKCFPNFGEIQINKLMVKRKSCFYCLPESFLMKYAFQGVKKTRFIHIEASALTSINKTCLSGSKCQQTVGYMINDAQVTDRLDPGGCVTIIHNDNVSVEPLVSKLLPAVQFLKKKRVAKRVKRKCFLSHLVKGLEDGNLPGEECFIGKDRFDIFPDNVADKQRGESRTCSADKHRGESRIFSAHKHREGRSTCSRVETASDTLSVSNIIKKYFKPHEEVTSDSEINSGTSRMVSHQLKATTYDNCSNITINMKPHWMEATPRRVTVPPYCTRSRSLISGNKSKRTKPGSNIVQAFSKLGILASKQNTNTSVCRVRQKKLALEKSTSVVKNLVFEISDNSD